MKTRLAAAIALALATGGCGGGRATQELERIDAALRAARDQRADAAEHLDELAKQKKVLDVDGPRFVPTDGTKTLLTLERTVPGAKLSYVAATRALSASGRGGGAAAAAAVGAMAGALPGLDVVSLDVGAAGEWTSSFRLADPPPPAPSVDELLTEPLPPHAWLESPNASKLRQKIAAERRELRELDRLVGDIGAVSAKVAALEHAKKALPTRACALRNATADADFLFGGAAPILHDGSLAFTENTARVSGTTALPAATLATRVSPRYDIALLAADRVTLTRRPP